MRKLIRSVAAARFSSGEAKRFGQGLRTKPELNAARQSYWDTLLIGPGLLTVTNSLRQQGRDVWQFLEQAKIAHHRDGVMPSLLSDP